MKYLIVLVMLSSGCAAVENMESHIKSSILGLQRKITLYSATGEVVRSWECNCQVEDKGGTVRFVLPTGKAVTVSGTFVVEEL